MYLKGDIQMKKLKSKMKRYISILLSVSLLSLALPANHSYAIENSLGGITFNDTTSLANMENILSSTHTLAYSDGQALSEATTQAGDALFVYNEPATVTANGVTALDITTDDSWRCGAVFRAMDENNYSWVGFDNATTLRIRECINGSSSDTLETIAAMPASFRLEVKYWGDSLKIFADGTQIFSGSRPRAAEPDNNTIVTGKSGVMGWSIHHALFDNLTISRYAPSVEIATVGSVEGAIEGQNISFTMPYGTDLSGLTPSFTTNPSTGVEVSPVGVQDFSNGNMVVYTFSLSDGGTQTYNVSAKWAPMEVYTNEFTGSENAALIAQMVNIGDTGNTITHSSDRVTIANSSGNDLYIDSASPNVANGIASVDYINHSEWRSGILFRAVDSNNFSWAALESANRLRIRENIAGTERDILVDGLTLPGNSFELSVQYYGDYLLVKADDTVLYNGVRPFKDGNDPLSAGPVSGHAGVMGWSVKNTSFDNLKMKEFVPSIIAASGTDAVATISDKKIQYTLNHAENLSSFTPSFTAFPPDAAITPVGPQDFAAYNAAINGIPYTISVGAVNDVYQVFASSSNQDTLCTIENSKISVRFNKQFPAVYDYTYKGTTNGVIGGSDLSYSDSIKINDKSYSPTVVFNELEDGSIKYDITLTGVTVGSVTGKTVTFSVIYTLVDSTVEMQIIDVTGDETNKPFKITIDSPIFSIRENGDHAAVTTGGSNGNGGDGGTSYLASTGSLNKSSLSYVFASNDKAAAAVYTQDQYNRPYSAKIGTYNNAKKGLVYSDGYNYRLSDGVRPSKDIDANNSEYIPYKLKVYLCADANNNGNVDWQDAALWIRTQIPQMPDSVREFFNGGSWAQTHAAFPGNGNNGTSAVSNYAGFTTIYSELSQLLEAQKQIYNMTDGIGRTSFEVVGWNGRGHDYAWPNINEVTYNPALGTEAEFTAMQTAMKAYNGDLSFHTNQTDMCDNSESYLRNQESNIYGNRAASTGIIQYNSSVFGWNAYKMSHFKDLSSALNRINAFIGTTENVGTAGRFNAPQFLYSDVMLDYPASGYTNTDEQYAKFRLVDRYETLGTNLATEYYFSEKRTGGLYLMKNNSYPNIVDQFINAGQTIINDTRNVAVQAKDYIWANLYSDVYRDGNASIAGSGNGNKLSTIQTEETFLLSYLNGFVGKNKLQSYTENGTKLATNWSNGVVFQADTSTNKLTVTENSVTLANLQLTGGRIMGDSFIPAYDGTNRIFAFSSNGGQKTWTIPSYISGTGLQLYRLTSDGRVYEGAVSAVEGKVTLNLNAGVAYVLDYTSGASTDSVSENVILTSDVTASSNEKRAIWSSYITEAPIPSEDIYVSKPDGSPWQVDNDPLLKDLTTKMFKSGDATKLRYYRFIISGYSADGVDETYWKPETGGSHWINYAFTGNRTISSLSLKHQSSTDNLTASFTATKADGSTVELYQGTVGKDFNYVLSDPVQDVVSIKVNITNAAGVTVKISEVAAKTL